MTLFHLSTITWKQKIIIRILFEYRGLLYEQLIEELSHRFARGPSTRSFAKNTYKDLQKLEEQRLIIRDPIKLGRTKDMIYLSEAGHEYAGELLGIFPGHVGSGWDKDYGDFPYELQRPPRPSSPVVHHHLMVSDVLLRLERLKDIYPQLNIDYRDNRYCSVKFESGDMTYRFKPDGDLILNGDRFLLEVDRGTEFGEKLREKFQSYKRYLDQLNEAGEELPTGVLFICDKETYNGMLKRWTLISSVFWTELAEWRPRFNLIGINGSVELEKVLVRQGSRTQQFNDFFAKSSKYSTENISFGILNSGQGLTWGQPVFSINKANPDYRMFAFERVEQFETIGLARLYEWYSWIEANRCKYSDIKRVTQFVPVLVQLEGKPYGLIFKGFEDEETLQDIFKSAIRLNTQEAPIWRDSVGNRTDNPLDD